MSSSGSDFDDDDDELLLALATGKSTVVNKTIVPTQSSSQATRPNAQVQNIRQRKSDNSNNNNTNNSDSAQSEIDIQARLYRADGEVAILRAQLQQLQKQKQEEIGKLKETNGLLKKNQEEQVNALKYTVQKLEDEKKFLNNELKTTSISKKRKTSMYHVPKDDSMEVDLSPIVEQQVLSTSPSSPPTISSNRESDIKLVSQRVIKMQNDSSLFADQIWNYCINGTKRTSLSYLSNIYFDSDIKIKDFKVLKKTPISSSIIEYLMLKKSLRLDELISEFCLILIDLINELFEKNLILAIPFLLSLIHCSISFRPVAISEDLIKLLLKQICEMSINYSFLLDSNLNQDDFINYHDVPNQIMILEKFILICCVDLIEKLISLTTLFDTKFIKLIWKDDILSIDLIVKFLPENTERFKSSAQINLIYNIVEMLLSSITEETFAFNDNDRISDKIIFSSLLKIFLIELPIKDDFMFYGLNRIIGNNIDINKIDSIIPHSLNLLDNSMVSIPEPIPFALLKENQNNDKMKFELLSNHEFHLLNLRIKVTNLLESYIIIKQSTEFLESKEHIKSIIRIIGFEQINIMKSPRSKYINLRIQIISNFIKILNYLIKTFKNLNNLIYPETIYEIFVVLSRIAFGSDSLSIEGHKLLMKIRQKGYLNEFVFNPWCEQRARELNHLNYNNVNGEILANIESDFANGLEFPYESDTIELAREILNSFVNHEEADNLYFNMSYEEFSNFDEMDLVHD